MKKVTFILIFLLFIFLFLSFNQKENKAKYIDFITDRYNNFDSYSVRCSDIDLTLKFLFTEKDFSLQNLKSEFIYLVNYNKDLFLIQYNGLKSFFNEYLKKNNELYKVNFDSLNEYYYFTKRIKVILYDEKYLHIKRSFVLEKIPKIEYIKMFINPNLYFDNSVEYYIYYITKMFKSDERINKFYNDYALELNKKYKENNLDEISDFLCTTFNIKNRQYLKILLDILPEIYSCNNYDKFITAGQYDAQDYKNQLIANLYSTNYIALCLDIFKNKYLLLKYFIKQVFYNLQTQSLWLKNLVGLKKEGKSLKIKDLNLSFLNSFLSDLAKLRKDDLYEIDATFSTLYLLQNIQKTYPELCEGIMIDFDETDYASNQELKYLENKYDINLQNEKLNDSIYSYLLLKYIDFCKENGFSAAVFYSNGIDVLVSLDDFSKDTNPNNKNLKLTEEILSSFLFDYINKNKVNIIKEINKAIKFFELNSSGLNYEY